MEEGVVGNKNRQLPVFICPYVGLYFCSSEAISFWSKDLGISRAKFRKPYIKKTSESKRRNYKSRFGYGTCNVYIANRDLRETIAMSIERLRAIFGGVDFDPEKAI